MIIGFARLPDVRLLRPYVNTVKTPFGMNGRDISPAALAFYKIIVWHGSYVLEYVVATSQEFQIPFRGLRERVTGLKSNDISLVNMAPISVKIVNQSSNICDSYLFVNSITYLLLFGGNFEPLSGSGVVEFSQYPSYISANKDPHLAPMAYDDFCNVISLTSLIANIPGNYVIPDEVPNELHSINIAQAMQALSSQTPDSFTLAATPNDSVLVNWIFNMLSTDMMNLDCSFIDFIGAVTDRYAAITSIAQSEPICRACLNTASVVRLVNISQYIDMASTSMYCAMSYAYTPQANSMIILDRVEPMFKVLDCDEILQTITYSSVIDIVITIAPGGRLTIQNEGTWSGSISPTGYGAITSQLRIAYASVCAYLRENNITLVLSKNWLDEVWITITTSNGTLHYYIPTWIYNLSSPLAINATLSTGLCNTYINHERNIRQ